MGRLITGQAGILHLLDGNSAYRNLYLTLIGYCREERAEAEVLSCCEENKVSANQIQSAPSIVATLVSAGALSQAIYVDGFAYDGTFSDLQSDETIPEDAEISIFYRSTEDGLAAAAFKDEELSFAHLVAENPGRKSAFELVLSLCARPEGATTRELQDALKQADMLETEEARGIDALHASYFTGSLEHIGALVWNRNKWVTSEKGLAALSC